MAWTRCSLAALAVLAVLLAVLIVWLWVKVEMAGDDSTAIGMPVSPVGFLFLAKHVMKQGKEVIQMGEVEKRKEQNLWIL